MKQYSFISEAITEMYNAVCDECFDKIHEVMEEINNTEGVISDEQNARFEKINDSISINITIGSHTIIIPNNADNIELLFCMINDCREQTI